MPLLKCKLLKKLRAKRFSVSLRPCTLVHTEATADVPFLTDLDLVKEAWKKLRHYHKTNASRGRPAAPTKKATTKKATADAGACRKAAPTEAEENMERSEQHEEGLLIT